MTTRKQLQNLADVVLCAPADHIELAVADALLPLPLPSSLRTFLTASDGARIGAVEVFSAQKITQATNAGGHRWQIPSDTLIIGTAGAGRALIMTGGRGEVYEIDDDPWDARSMELTADTPLDLFVRHRGISLRDRAPWSALPGLGPAIDTARASLSDSIDALLETGIASQVGTPLPSSIEGFRYVTAARATQLLAADAYESFLVNYRPVPPALGPSAAREWERACEAIVLPELRERIRTAPVPEAITALGPSGADDGLSIADGIRDLSWLILLGAARDDLASSFEGTDHDGHSLLRRLRGALLSGRIPVSLDAAI